MEHFEEVLATGYQHGQKNKTDTAAVLPHTMVLMASFLLSVFSVIVLLAAAVSSTTVAVAMWVGLIGGVMQAPWARLHPAGSFTEAEGAQDEDNDEPLLFSNKALADGDNHNDVPHAQLYVMSDDDYESDDGYQSD